MGEEAEAGGWLRVLLRDDSVRLRQLSVSVQEVLQVSRLRRCQEMGPTDRPLQEGEKSNSVLLSTNLSLFSTWSSDLSANPRCPAWTP